jgi:hypothetical protein
LAVAGKFCESVQQEIDSFAVHKSPKVQDVVTRNKADGDILGTRHGARKPLEVNTVWDALRAPGIGTELDNPFFNDWVDGDEGVGCLKSQSKPGWQ